MSRISNSRFPITLLGVFVGVLAFCSLTASCLYGISKDSTAKTAQFFAEADQRIEGLRKRDVVIKIVDAEGQPVPAADIELTQTRNLFGFGSALRPWDMPFKDENYRRAFTSLFEWMIDEGSLNWAASEPNRDQPDFYIADNVVNWAIENNIKIMGAPIFWEGEMQPWQEALRGEDLRQQMAERLPQVIERYRGKIDFWTPENEMLAFDHFVDELGPEIRPWMFRRAQEIDPDVKLMVNDYDIITGTDTGKLKRYIALIRDLQSKGANIEAIGLQAHFVVEEEIDPIEVYDRIDQVAELGIPIWITEYDFGTPDEALRADGLEALYRAAFSHPMVDGIIMWGFYEDAQWRMQYLPQYGPAHIMDKDWTLNAAGERYVALRKRWRTDASGRTDQNGVYRFRGFHGAYDIAIRRPEAPSPETLSIDVVPGAEPQQAVLALNP